MLLSPDLHDTAPANAAGDECVVYAVATLGSHLPGLSATVPRVLVSSS